MLSLLLLPAIDHGLAEQAMLVTNTVSMGSYAQGRHTLHKTRCQTAQATIAQGRIRLQQTNAFKVDIKATECLAGDIEQA
ncbi:hypothetical protein D3C79_758550 [compost metagenome]